jgi:choline dehydrogenase-like flavoprotein
MSESYDAVVIGAGASGGLAALLLAEAGLRVLVLNAGASHSPMRSPVHWLIGHTVRRLAEPEGLRFIPPALAYKARTILKHMAHGRQPIQSQCYAWERAPQAFIDDHDCPYTTPGEHSFVWLRSRQLGGRMVIPGHGRQYYRFGPNDFSPDDGLSPVWPLKPGELDRWYSLVERRLQLAGGLEGFPWLPDSELSVVLKPTVAEATLAQTIHERWPGAPIALGRYAPPLEALLKGKQTGRLLIKDNSIVKEIEVDDSGRVRGVVWIDEASNIDMRMEARLVFLCASALESTRILLLSHPWRVIGASSKSLGRFLMDHVMTKAEGVGRKLPVGTNSEEGRLIYLARFDAREMNKRLDGGRGYGVQIYQSAGPGQQSYFTAVAFGEMLPDPNNRVALDNTRKDKWGVPVLHIDCTHRLAEQRLANDQRVALKALAEVAGVTLRRIDEEPAPPGSANHECGTARMGRDPSTSVLDPYNQCWDAHGLYVTDAACFPSQGAQNPTLTILALTARACDHAIINFRSRS